MILARLRDTLRKTRDKLAGGLDALLVIERDLDDDFLRELESALYAGDLGSTGHEILGAMRAEYQERKLRRTSEVRAKLRALLRAKLGDVPKGLAFAASGPTVVLIVGVNGSGKTTSAAKLAKRLSLDGKKVMLAACDTFRAAAVEQLSQWAARVGVPIVKPKVDDQGTDPAAIAFDAATAAQAQGIDVLIVDTAGRLHTREDLMAELGKVRRVLDKRIPGAPHETFLVLDATTGQNAIRQAEVFTQVVPLTGVVLAKLDGTARGGAVVSIRDRLGIPVRYVGTGEKADDLEPFDPERFLDALLVEHA